jgi:hypothetical protein
VRERSEEVGRCGLASQKTEWVGGEGKKKREGEKRGVWGFLSFFSKPFQTFSTFQTFKI